MFNKTQHPINAGIDAAIRYLTSKVIETVSVNAQDFARAISPLRDILRATSPSADDEHYQGIAELLGRYTTGQRSTRKLSAEQVKIFLLELDELRVVKSEAVKISPFERLLIEELRKKLADLLPAERETIDIIAARKHLAESHWHLFFAGTHQSCPYAYAAITKYTAEMHRQERMNRWQLIWYIDQIEQLLDRAAFSESQFIYEDECICSDQNSNEAEACHLIARFYLSPIIPSNDPIFMSSDLESEIEHLESTTTSDELNSGYINEGLVVPDDWLSESLPPQLDFTLRSTLELLYEKLCGITNSINLFHSIEMKRLLLATLIFLEDECQTSQGRHAYVQIYVMYIEVCREVMIHRELLECYQSTVKSMIVALRGCVSPVEDLS